MDLYSASGELKLLQRWNLKYFYSHTGVCGATSFRSTSIKSPGSAGGRQWIIKVVPRGRPARIDKPTGRIYFRCTIARMRSRAKSSILTARRSAQDLIGVTNYYWNHSHDAENWNEDLTVIISTEEMFANIRNCFIKCHTKLGLITDFCVTLGKIRQIFMRKRGGSDSKGVPSMARIINNSRGKRLRYKYLIALALDSLLTIPVARSIVTTRWKTDRIRKEERARGTTKETQ